MRPCSTLVAARGDAVITPVDILETDLSTKASLSHQNIRTSISSPLQETAQSQLSKVDKLLALVITLVDDNITLHNLTIKMSPVNHQVNHPVKYIVNHTVNHPLTDKYL